MPEVETGYSNFASIEVNKIYLIDCTKHGSYPSNKSVEFNNNAHQQAKNAPSSSAPYVFSTVAPIADWWAA
jgi:hypothetical protein